MEAKERNYGIDLLRIVTMYVIMILHVQGKGGVFDRLSPLGLGYEITWFLEIACYFSGTVYALISGYVILNGKYKITNIIYLWLQVFFYGFWSTLLFFIFKREVVNLSSLKHVFFPVMSETYWYFSAYFAAFFFIPMIRLAMEQLKKIYLDLIALFFIVFFSVLPCVFPVDVFALRGGMSFSWVLGCIYLGAYMKKFNVFEKVKSSVLIILFWVGVITTWLSKLAIELHYGLELWNRDRGNVLVTYNSPPILLASVVLIPLFMRIPLKGKILNIVKRVSPLTFGVYLLNCQPLIWEYIVANRFADYAYLPVWKMMVCIILAATAVFLIGIAVDGIRFIIFEVGHLRQKLTAIENYIIRDR